MPRGLGHAACPPWGFENSAWRKGCGPASLRGQGWATVPARCSPSWEEAGLSCAGCGGVGGDLGAGGSVPSENTRVRGACVQALVAEGGVEVEADSRTVMTGRAQGACPRASRAECASQVRWSVFSSITQTHPSPVAPGNVALGTGHRTTCFYPLASHGRRQGRQLLASRQDRPVHSVPRRLCGQATAFIDTEPRLY